MQNNTKSSAVAGILGVFLGAFGGHDWYLNNTKKAIIHVCLCVGGLLLLMVAIILTKISESIPAINILFICLTIMSYVIIVGNAVWGIIEGIVIIAQGDAGLKAKGYQVADLATTTMAPTAPVAATGDAVAPAAVVSDTASAGAAKTEAVANTAAATENAKTETATSTAGNFAVADNSKIEPAHLDNIITAAPANGSVMSSAPVAQATPEVATPANPTTVTPVEAVKPAEATVPAESVVAKPAEAPVATEAATAAVPVENSAVTEAATPASVDTTPKVNEAKEPVASGSGATTTAPASPVSDAAGSKAPEAAEAATTPTSTPPVSPAV